MRAFIRVQRVHKSLKTATIHQALHLFPVPVDSPYISPEPHGDPHGM